MFNALLNNAIAQYNLLKPVQLKIQSYFNQNAAARAYTEICEESDWPIIFDHLTVRTYEIDKASEQYLQLGWKYDETIEYKNEGWWAKVLRNSDYAPLFIDQSYPEAGEQIIKKWVDKFGDQNFHHIAVRLPEEVEIEEVIEKLKVKEVHFPGRITGNKGTRLRQIFSQAEIVDGTPFSVLELAQRKRDELTGKIYEGFISEQADSLMKDSVL